MFDKLRQEVKDVKRLDQILLILAKHELKSFSQGKKITPIILREMLEELGGTFIKLGQLLSIRPDLIPNEYCIELRKLQDNIKPIPFEKIKQVVDKDYKNSKLIIGKKVLGSASIAQVHEAKLNKKKVVVKIIKPGIREKFYTDLELIKTIAKFVNKNVKTVHFDPILVYEEFEEYTRKELDLTNELENLKATLQFKHEKEILIPIPEIKYCKKDILVMSYIPGNKISKQNKIRNSGNIIAREFWNQIFENGVFHADPHPGNFLVKNKIGIVDWGIIGKFSSERKELMKKIFFGIILQNTDMIADSVLKLNSRHSVVNRDELRKDLKFSIGKYYGKNMEELQAKQIFNDLLNMVKKHNIYLDRDYVLFMKCIITLEGTGLVYDKNFNFFREAEFYVNKNLKKTFKEIAVEEVKSYYHALAFAKTIPEQASAFFDEELKQEQLLQNIQNQMQEMNNGLKVISKELIIMFAMLIILVGAFLLLPYKNGSIPVMSIAGFVLSTALFLQLIHFLLR